MDVTRATKGKTEAQLEARARAALLKALPWLDGATIEQQVSFTVRFGHAVVHVNGKEPEHVTGRADVLVSVDGRPMFVVELKRPGLGVNVDDVEQGLSYARVLHPRPPLVMVTDGDKTLFVETHGGEEWRPVSKDAEALRALLGSAALVAADDMKRAVSRLLGVDPKAWVTAVRAVTEFFIAERTGGWATPELPFVDGFLLPRRAVSDAVRALEAGRRLVFIEADPLSGKSSALRALASALAGDDRFAVLALDADAGIDLFTALADILSAHLFWPITPHEARHWIQQLSRTEGTPLVLAIDDFDGGRDNFRRDLESLSSQLFGDRIRIVLALDSTAARRLRTASNGRTQSALMRRGPELLTLGPLDNEEFAEAREHLEEHGVVIMDGGERSREYRQPWVLRAMVSAILADRSPAPGMGITIPSIPTLDLLTRAEERLRGGAGPISSYREVAEALLDDAASAGRSTKLTLRSLEAYVVRRTVLREHLGDLEIRELVDAGLLQEAREEDGEAVFYPKMQDVLAAQLSRVVARRILEADDPAELARDLTDLASIIPLGPVVVAQAMFGAAEEGGTLDYSLVQALLAIEPRHEALERGKVVVGRMPDGTVFEITALDGGRLQVRVGDQVGEVDGEGAGSLADLDAWMILSYLATRRMAADTLDGSRSRRLDASLMLQIGGFPAPLVKPGGVDDMLATHDLPGGVEALCHDTGIYEPITYALLLFFTREPEHGAAFVAAALERRSVSLLLRIDAALGQLSRFNGDAARTAAELRETAVLPAIRLLLEKLQPDV